MNKYSPRSIRPISRLLSLIRHACPVLPCQFIHMLEHFVSWPTVLRSQSLRPVGWQRLTHKGKLAITFVISKMGSWSIHTPVITNKILLRTYNRSVQICRWTDTGVPGTQPDGSNLSYTSGTICTFVNILLTKYTHICAVSGPVSICNCIIKFYFVV